MTKTNWQFRRKLVLGLIAVDVVLMAWMLYMVAEPYLHASPGSAAKTEEAKVKLPGYGYSAWEVLPVLEGGRVKPLQTVAIESVREITGRSRFEDQPPIAVLLSWMFYRPGQVAPGGVDWDSYPFILCEDREVRAAIFGVTIDDEAAHDKVHGKRIAPADLRTSVPFQRLIVEVNKHEALDAERFEQKLTPLQRKAYGVFKRLRSYELITLPHATPEARTAAGATERIQLGDPVHFVALDRVANAPWFSIGELRYLSTVRTQAPHAPEEMRANSAWWDFLHRQRVSKTPNLYLTAEVKQALTEFQQAIKAGKTDPLFDEMDQEFKRTEGMMARMNQMSKADVVGFLKSQGKNVTEKDVTDEMLERIRNDVQSLVEEHKKKRQTLADLRSRVRGISKPYVVDDPRYTPIYLDYLEARYPDMYNDAVRSQPFPAAEVKAVLAAHDALSTAYHGGDAARFQQASQTFFTTIESVSKKFAGDHYPGVDTIDLELSLNRVEPFKWAWIAMLVSTLIFAVSMKTDSKAVYMLGFLPLFISLAFQLYAYYGRVAISGRPPVSNMFETVVFVASMAAVFALILEAFYRKTIIILSGAAIATLGMILADQLPTSSGFSDKIKPLEPVLRSNYWLIIHVMTIVASYAAGALAWGIGNISLILYWFNSDRKDLLRMMSNLSYSAIKIAVLLLGVGTLLGGIWAAESWGRFWGWDPKETWALIALVVYLIPLHARYVGWVKDFGMAVASVVCFAGIVMSWYGVNFILAAGLHSYGMGDGGPWTIFLLGTINLLWVLIVCLKRTSQELATAPVAMTAAV